VYPAKVPSAWSTPAPKYGSPTALRTSASRGTSAISTAMPPFAGVTVPTPATSSTVSAAGPHVGPVPGGHGPGDAGTAPSRVIQVGA
jgi:hypothetical protein